MAPRIESAKYFWRTVPSLYEQAQVIDETVLYARPRPEFARRSVLKACAALGTALAFNVLGALPPSRPRKASATVGTEYLGCANYDTAPGYDNNTLICVGAPYSRDYCGGDGWFLHTSGTCFSSSPTKACGTGGLAARNAWRWPWSGRSHRCADGWWQTCGSSPVFRICDWAL